MAPRSLWSALPLFLLLVPALALDNDYSFYPEGAQDCLYQAADTAGCTNGTITELNSCQCKNENDFVLIAAKCIGKNDYADVDEVYTDMSDACENSETSLSVTQEEFREAAEEGASSSSSATGATTSATQSSKISSSATASESAYVTTTSGGKTITVAPTQTNDNDGDEASSGLSTGTTIGIGAGAAAVGALVVGALVFFCLRRRPKKGEDEHPMLPQPYQGANPTQFPPPYYDPKAGWTGSPTPSPIPSKGWNTPASAHTQNPFATPVAELPPQTAPRAPSIYEMDGGITQFGAQVGPVEMPGSDIQRRSGSHQDAWQKR